MALTQGYSAGGSINSATSASNAWSNTAGNAASAVAQQQAQLANQLAYERWKEAADYNSAEAQKARDWQEKMANSTYQRTVNDMVKAGINPILAASAGFSADSVGSGATASISQADSYMGNTFAEQNSASTASSQSDGSSWQNSENGLGTFLTSLGSIVDGMMSSLNASKTINIALNGLKEGAEVVKESAVKASKKSNPAKTELDKSNYGTSKSKTTNKIIQSLERSIKGLTATTGGNLWTNMNH